MVLLHRRLLVQILLAQVLDDDCLVLVLLLLALQTADIALDALVTICDCVKRVC